MGPLLSTKPHIRRERKSGWHVYRRTGYGAVWVWRHKAREKAWESYKTTIEQLRAAGLLWEVFP